MTTTVNLNSDLVSETKVYAKVENRSTTEQIEFWAKIGRIMIENPELSYNFVQESLLATEEVEQGLVQPWTRRNNEQ